MLQSPGEIDVLPMVQPRSFAVSTNLLYLQFNFKIFNFMSGLGRTERSPRTSQDEDLWEVW